MYREVSPTAGGPIRHILLFFFSSRRRHTRLQGDWSSDVCSSDLQIVKTREARAREVQSPGGGGGPGEMLPIFGRAGEGRLDPGDVGTAPQSDPVEIDRKSVV